MWLIAINRLTPLIIINNSNDVCVQAEYSFNAILQKAHYEK